MMVSPTLSLRLTQAEENYANTTAQLFDGIGANVVVSEKATRYLVDQLNKRKIPLLTGYFNPDSGHFNANTTPDGHPPLRLFFLRSALLHSADSLLFSLSPAQV